MTAFLNKSLCWLSITTLLLTACQKERDVVPVADFSYDFADPNVKNYLPGYPVGTGIKLTNKSKDGESYSWDFGDGTTSKEKEPTIAYKKSGPYTITLTTTSATGTQRTTTQPIKVLDCVLKKITINRIKWNALENLPTWDDTKKADLTIEIGQRVPSGVPSSSPTAVGTSLYRSTLKAVMNTTTPFTSR